ncbi:MAG: hypothetical protein ACE5J5_04280 [Candidatus Hydrothermarchaeales archaeon]
MKRALFILALLMVIIPVPVMGKTLPGDFVSYYDTCLERSNTCFKELPNRVKMFLSWTSDTRYIVSFGNNNPENITGVYDIEVKLQSDFGGVEIIALGNNTITPKKAENGLVTFDYEKEIAAGGYGKVFITLTEGPVEETKPTTTPQPTTNTPPATIPPPTTNAPSTTMPPSTTQPPVTTPPKTASAPELTVQPATTVPTETEVVENPLWKPLQGLIITIVLSTIIALVLLKSGVLEPPE